ncbi:MAG TPA: hypothetical protein VK171_11775 [Fimbriimonas sp.]|nr:hypothetical protein [Fimbriimonas sp.]
MIPRIWNGLSKLCPDRFEAFRQPGDGDEFDALARYFWNVALCEALTPVLNGAEICLRNAIHLAVSTAEGDEMWFSSKIGRLRPQEQELIQRATRDLANKSKFTPGPGDYVSELTFKFWTGLLSDHYQVFVWHDRLDKLMPNLGIGDRNVGTVRKAFNRIRELRNRAFHHEPILNGANAVEIHDQAVEAIGWISNYHKRCIATFDRFPEVFASGETYYRELLEIEFKLRAPVAQPTLFQDDTFRR